ncbi:hypothetical protein R6Q59_029717 [Mikania micrantha]
MVRTEGEGGESSLTPPIVENEGLSDDDDDYEDEETNTSNEEKEINDEKEDSGVDIVDPPQPKKVRGRGKNKNLLEKFASNNNKPLELDLYPEGSMHKFVGENASLFIRFISNEVARVPFHYPSWDRVPEHDKLGIYRTLNSQLSDMQETIRLMNENRKRMQDEIDALKSKKHGTSIDSGED